MQFTDEIRLSRDVAGEIYRLGQQLPGGKPHILKSMINFSGDQPADASRPRPVGAALPEGGGKGSTSGGGAGDGSLRCDDHVQKDHNQAVSQQASP